MVFLAAGGGLEEEEERSNNAQGNKDDRGEGRSVAGDRGREVDEGRTFRTAKVDDIRVGLAREIVDGHKRPLVAKGLPAITSSRERKGRELGVVLVVSQKDGVGGVLLASLRRVDGRLVEVQLGRGSRGRDDGGELSESRPKHRRERRLWCL